MQTSVKKKMLCSSVSLIAVLTLVGTAFAGSAVDLAVWNDTGSCAGCNLSCGPKDAPIAIPTKGTINLASGLVGTNFTDCSFVDGFSLAGANLTQTIFDGADLRGISLDGATIEGTSFHKTKFGKNAKFKKNTGASNLKNLKNATVASYWLDAELEDADKPDIFPGKANLTGAKWSKGKSCMENSNQGKCKHSTCDPQYVRADGTCAQ